MLKSIRISSLRKGDSYEGVVKIIKKIIQNPLVFQITDGLTQCEAVFPSSVFFKPGDIIQVEAQTSERFGKLQLLIKTAVASNAAFGVHVESLAEPPLQQPLIDSPLIEQMYQRMSLIAKKIRLSLLDRRPVVLRYHADADGITSVLAIETACRSFLKEMGEPGQLLYRNICKAPYYDVGDALKDSTFQRDRKPLVVVLDNGSTPEDLQGIRIGTAAGLEIVVVDHHPPEMTDEQNTQSTICPLVSLHLNPYLYGGTSSLTTGMMCTEIARLIHPSFSLDLLAAVSGAADKSSSMEMDLYLKVSGKKHEEALVVAQMFDYLIYHTHYDQGLELYHLLLTNDSFCEVVRSQVEQAKKRQIDLVLQHEVAEKKRDLIVVQYDFSLYKSSGYPPPGKFTGMLHDIACKKYPDYAVITLGLLEDMVIIRQNKITIAVPDLVARLQKEGFVVNGGGHPQAGSLKVLSSTRDKILIRIKEIVFDVAT